MLITTITLILIFSLLIVEKRMIQKSIRFMSLRIQVNGTRGKSSVTEYIAAGILASGHEVMAKVTGITPTIIHNGFKHVIDRSGPARVQEQVNIINSAFRKRVKTMVLECMSIAPELQRLEGSIFKPHIYVITNIRDDHRESMGKDVDAQAEAICNAIPANCRVITNEVHYLNKIKEKASAKNSTVITCGKLEERLKSKLPDAVFGDNLALALTVCREAGMNTDLSEAGIMNWISQGDSPLSTVQAGNKNIRFLNAFAANDIDSTNTFIEHWKSVSSHDGKVSLILNTRADRPFRTGLFTDWITGNYQLFDRIILAGNHQGRARYTLLRSGIEKKNIRSCRRSDSGRMKSLLADTVDDGAFVVGVGNIGGEGFHILKELR
jgi:poly-gamma-glutamate synthase PgsB/CapB